jgi:allantoin racemase
MPSPARILVVNPNTTASMTRKVAEAARQAASVGTEIVATNPDYGPVSIEGYVDEAYAVPGMLEEIRKADGSVCGVVIACFDDTGLDAARCVASGPVVGIGEAAFHCASLIAGRFCVVTTLSRSVPAIEHNLVRYGLDRRCAAVLASEVPVLALEEPGSRAHGEILGTIRRARDAFGCDAVVLGCAGMTDLAARLTHEAGLTVIDGVGCAVKLVESLVHLGLATARTGGYAPPLPKPYSGRFSDFGFAGVGHAA